MTADSWTPPDLTYLQAILPYLAVAAVAFAVTLIATPAIRAIAIKKNIIDHPDMERKNHEKPIAYLGGLAIFLGWLVAFIYGGFDFSLLTQANANQFARFIEDNNFPIAIIIGGIVIVTVGMIDDIVGSSPRVKIGGQLIAAAALAWGNVGTKLIVDIATLLHLPLTDGLAYILGAAFIAILVIGSCNAINLIDGLDGLASGVTAITMLGFLVLAASLAVNFDKTFQDPVTAPRIVMCLAVFGALLGFLVYNFNPASIFMGDAGSLLLGYLAAAVILMFVRASDLAPPGVRPALGPRLVIAALIVFGLPIADTVMAIIRRKMSGKPIMSPDSNHLHHQFLRFYKSKGLANGNAVKAAVATMYLLAVAFAVMGTIMIVANQRWQFVLGSFIVVYLLVVVAGIRSGVLQRRMAHEQTPANDNPTAPSDNTETETIPS